MMIAADSVLHPSENVFAREFDGEIVLLDLTGGVYYGLDALASRVWTLSTKGRTLREVASVVLPDYDVDEQTLLKDVVALANEWVGKGLVRLTV